MNRNKGFTLIELLIVIAIIAIIAAVIFVALDPLKRFQDSRDSTRWQEVNSILEAVRIDQVDNGGNYGYGVRYDTSNASIVDGVEYMISNATTTTGCNTSCSSVFGANDCVNLNELVREGYLGELPISPNGAYAWNSTWTGYYVMRNENDSITVGACENENSSDISVTQ
jgi:prepilin-type N-terminal cleavage/methylation domain-containing protein